MMIGSFILKVSGVFLSFLLNIILVRTMGLEEYGRYNYIISIINFFSILAIFGLDNVGIKYLTKYYVAKDFNRFNKFYFQSEKFVIVTSSLLVIGFISSSFFFFDDNIYNIFFISICALLIPLKSLINIYYSVLRAVEKLYLYLSLDLIVKPLLLIFIIPLIN